MVNMKINFTTFNDLTKQLLYKPQTPVYYVLLYTHTHTQYARGTCTGAHAVIIILVY